MNQKENKAEQTLKMANYVENVDPSEALMSRLHAIPGNIKNAYDRVPKKVVWTVAASIAVLIVMNAVSFRQYSSAEENVTNQNGQESHFSYLKQL